MLLGWGKGVGGRGMGTSSKAKGVIEAKENEINDENVTKIIYNPTFLKFKYHSVHWTILCESCEEVLKIFLLLGCSTDFNFQMTSLCMYL